MDSDTSSSRWNADISYVFSIHKAGMWMIGTWPLQVNNIPSKVRWAIVVVAGICFMSSQIAELLFDRGRTNATMEAFMMTEASAIALLKQVIMRIYIEKLRTNVNSATDDWLYLRDDEESLKVMKKYAHRGRSLIIIILHSLNMCFAAYICGTVMLIREQQFQDKRDANNASSMQPQRCFPLSSTWLNDKVNNYQYVWIVAFQLLIVAIMVTSQYLTDSFFVNIIIHLSGQLELLKMKFRNFHVNPGTEANQRKKLGSLVERHCWLRDLAKNLQDTFSSVIFFEAGLSAILIALSGVRSIENFKHRNFGDLIRSTTTIIYLSIHCCLYLSGGDILLTESEGIFYSIFETSWYQLSPKITKDLAFIMLRTKTPFSLNGGKLFYISRGTMIHIFQMAGSYISLLQAVQNYDRLLAGYYLLISRPFIYSAKMQKSYWGPDMAYVFSIHRMVLWTFGSWPLQGGFIFPLIRWIVITILELSLAVPSLVEFFVFHDSHEAILENLLYVECTILAVAKNIFPRIYINKLAINLRSAADDWSHALDQQEFYHVMRKFARTGRVITLTLFNSAYWAMCIFYLCIVFKPEILIDSSDNVRKGVMKKRKYLASFNWMSDYVGNSTFLAIFICQIIQTLVVGMRQTAVDSFFFNIVIHLCGQLEVLGMRFGNLGRNHGSIAQYQKELGRLVRRHCELMELVENIEDVFNVIILLQILMSVVLIGMTGFQFLVALGTDDRMLILRNFLIMMYLLLQSLLYTHAGDLLQQHSEQIFFSVYGISWYNLSPRASKDLRFVLMRANIPFHITGGKFIHISCNTMMNILKAAASYVSVLSVVMKD